MKVAYCTGFWCTNIGNGFFSMGVEHVLKKVLGEKNVTVVSDRQTYTTSYGKRLFMNKYELNDSQLEKVSGGTATTPVDDGFKVGDHVMIRTLSIGYCSGCGRLLNGSTAVITGHRGVLDGANVWWITRDCCGHRTSEISTAMSHA